MISGRFQRARDDTVPMRPTATSSTLWTVLARLTSRRRGPPWSSVATGWRAPSQTFPMPHDPSLCRLSSPELFHGGAGRVAMELKSPAQSRRP